MFLVTVCFYLFSFVLLASGVLVVTLRNPVTAVLSLIVAFFSAAGLFVLLQAEFVAMLLVIVYVGAVAVLFLFIVMMLNITVASLTKQPWQYVPIFILLVLVVSSHLILMNGYQLANHSSIASLSHPIPTDVAITNTHAIGHILYTNFAVPFQISGLILLVAMIGAITLTLRIRRGVKKQKISQQLARHKHSSVELVHVKTGVGLHGQS
jgi:NADH-quinone oxidoreductase subunit J